MRNLEIESQDIDNAVKAVETGKSAGTDGVVGEFISMVATALNYTSKSCFRKS